MVMCPSSQDEREKKSKKEEEKILLTGYTLTQSDTSGVFTMQQ